MLRREEERFLKMAQELGLLEGDRRDRAQGLAKEGARNRIPLPFALLHAGLLSDDDIDRVLQAMVERLDRKAAQADALHKDRQFTKAIDKYVKVLEVNPNHEGSLWGRAEAYFRLERYEEALGDYERLLEVSDRRAMVLNRKGEVLARLGRLEEALRDQIESTRLGPAEPQAHFDLGTCYQRLGRLAEALAAYTTAIELRQDFIEAYNNRAILHVLARNLEKAKSDWQTCVQLDRKRTTIRQNLRTLLGKLRPRS